MYPDQEVGRRLADSRPSPPLVFARSSSRHPHAKLQPSYGGGGWNFGGLGSVRSVDYGNSESGINSNSYRENARSRREETPISVSSDCWPHEDFQQFPGHVRAKRGREISSSDMEDRTSKRHQRHQSPARLATAIYSSDEYYESGRRVISGAVDPRYHSSPRQGPARNGETSHMSRPASRQRLLPETQGYPRSKPVHFSPRHRASPDHLSSPRTTHRDPGNRHASQMLPPEDNRRQERSNVREESIDPYCTPDRQDFRRTESEAPPSFRNSRQERSSEQLHGPHDRSSFLVQKPQLGSPFGWKQPPGTGMSITDNFIPTPRIRGHYAVTLNGNQKTPFESGSRSRSGVPYTPPSPHTPINQKERGRGRSKSRPSQVQASQIARSRSKSVVAEIPRFKNLKTTPGVRSYREIDDEDVYMADDDGTPMEQHFRKPKVGRAASLADMDDGNFRAANVLPKGSISYNDRLKPDNMKARVNSVKPSDGHPGPIYINLVSSPESSVSVTPVHRSIPMKDRLTPAKKAGTPKPTKKRMLTAKAENAEAKAAAEDARQQKAADAIVGTEIKAVITDLFGEAVAKDQDKEKERLEELRKREERVVVLKKAEATRLVELEKKRERGEAEEKEKREKEIEEERKRVKREAQRKKGEAAQQAMLEERRRQAQEKIETARAEEAERRAAEAVEAERKKQLALTVQADPAELAKLKAKQDAAREQAAALSTANLFVIEEAKKASAKPSSPPATSLRNLNATVEDDIEMEDSLFVPENPPTSTSLNTGLNHVTAGTISKSGSPEVDSLYDIDERRRRRAKSIGPSTAAEVFSQALPLKWPGREGYQAVRDAYDAEQEKKKADAAKARLIARWSKNAADRAKSEQVQDRSAPRKTASVKEKAKAEPAPKKPCVALKAKMNPKSAEPGTESTPDVEQSLVSERSQAPGAVNGAPVPHISATLASTATNTSSTSSGNLGAGIRIPPPPKLRPLHPRESERKAGIKVISDFEREQLDNAQKLQQSQQKKTVQKEKSEERKAAARQKRDEKARQRETTRLIEEGKANGIEVSEEDLAPTLDEFMAKRAIANRRRNETRDRAQKSDTNGSGNSPFEWEAQQIGPSLDVLEYIDPNDDDDPETARRKANERATQESLNALRRQARGQYSRYGSQKTVADMQQSSSEESEESEEDPDDDDDDDDDDMLQSIRASKAKNPSVMLAQIDEATSSTQTLRNSPQDQETEVKSTDVLNPDEYGTQIVEPLADMNPSFGGYAPQRGSPQSSPPHPRPRTRQQLSSTSNTPIKNRVTKPGGMIRLYMVKKVHNDDEPQLVGDIFSDRNEANRFAEAKVQECRKNRNKPASITENYNDDDLYSGMVTNSNGGTTTIYVSSQIKQTADLDGTVQIQPRLPERSYLIMRTIKTSVRDPETNITTVTKTTEPLEGMHFSDREYANNGAAKYLMSFLKPKRPNLDDIAEFENEMCAQIRDALKTFDEGRDCFSVELEKGNGAPRWMEEDSVEIEVQLFPMKGPLN